MRSVTKIATFGWTATTLGAGYPRTTEDLRDAAFPAIRSAASIDHANLTGKKSPPAIRAPRR